MSGNLQSQQSWGLLMYHSYINGLLKYNIASWTIPRFVYFAAFRRGGEGLGSTPAFNTSESKSSAHCTATAVALELYTYTRGRLYLYLL